MQHNTYHPHIDGLRAVAIILVIIFHGFPNLLPSGFIGVDIFFVISGYLISTIVLNDLKLQRFTFAQFYARRIRRIFPALLLVLLFVLSVGWFILYNEEYKELAWQALSGAGFFANFELWQESGYFDNAAETKPLLHLWSLSVEEQFYIFWSIALWFCFKRGYNLFKVTLITLLISFLCNIFLVTNYKEAAFYFSFCRFWEILLGAVLAIVGKDFPIDKKLANFSTVIAGIILFIALFFLDTDKAFPGYWALLPCVAAFLTIIAGNQAWLNKKILSHKFLVAIGLISYPLYLWHWPLISFMTIIKGRSPRTEQILAIIAIATLLSYLSYKFVEAPIRAKKSLLFSRIKILSALMIIVAAGAIVIIIFKGIDGRIDPKKAMMVRSMKRSDITDKACLKNYHKQVAVNYCRMVGQGDKKIFIIGDSHAQMLFDAYGKWAADHGYKIILLAKSACPFFAEISDVMTKDVKECSEIFTKIITIVSSEKPQLILYANNAWRYRRKEFATAMQQTLNLLPKDIPLVYFTQIPATPFAPTSCMSRSSGVANVADLKCTFSKAKYDKVMIKYKPIVEQLRKENKNLTTIDLSQIFCDAQECNVIMDGGFIYYRDGSHLSTHGASLIGKNFPLTVKK